LNNSTQTAETDSPAVQQPNSHMCFACGMENEAGLKIKFFDDGPGACRAEVILHDQHQGYPGIAHGGIVAAMLDEAVGRAPMSGDHERFMYTAKLEVRYRHHVPLHQPLTLIGRVTKDRGRVATAVAEVRLPDGTLAAEGSATLMNVPRELVDQLDPQRLGWKVYP
jgi:acyl-coenzyme A thioesterase PaaI-like protein